MPQRNRAAARRFHPGRAQTWTVLLSAAVILSASLTVAAETHKDFKFTMASGASLSLTNQNGSINVRPSGSRQLTVAATLQTDKVEVDSRQSGNRVTVRTHILQKGSSDENRVDYDISLPQDTSISIDSENGPIKVENLEGNVTIESDAGQVDVSGITNGGVSVETVDGAVNLTNLKNTRVNVVSSGGKVQLTSVTGPRVTVKTTTGGIGYVGDFAGGGNYSLMNHNGDIDVRLPGNASIDLSARSVTGAVSNDFPFQKPAHPSFQLLEGRSFAGTSNSGLSSVELRSFSGKIRVTKQ